MAKYYYYKYKCAWDWNKITNIFVYDGSRGVNIHEIFPYNYGINYNATVIDPIQFPEQSGKVYLGAVSGDYDTYQQGGYVDVWASKDRYLYGKTLSKPELEYYNLVTTGDFIEIVVLEEGTVDENKPNTKNTETYGYYWYVKGDKAIPTIKFNGQLVGAIKYKDSVGNVKNVSIAKYKDSTGVIKNIK